MHRKTALERTIIRSLEPALLSDDMNNLLSYPSFSVGTRTYTWQDVLLAAILRGEWSELEEQTRQGLALVRRAEATEESPSEQEIEATAQEFRYERELITAEEMEAWLAGFELTVDDWMDYLERSIIRKAQGDRADESLVSSAPTDEEIAECIGAEAVCSGALARFGEKLAARAAIDERSAGQKTDDLSAPRGEEFDRLVSEITESFTRSGFTTKPSPERIAEIARLERVFRDFSQGPASSSAIRAQIDAHRLDWIRLDLRELSFGDEAAAREASLCLREDREPLEAVAGNAHVPIRQARLYLDEIDPGARPDLLSARPGDLVGPVSVGDEFHLFLLEAKTMPSEEDPEVRRRAEETLLSRVVEQEVAARVRWERG